jgi:alpha-D-ribose 1-methylphosphonate 5-phosphate C-P lyase
MILSWLSTTATLLQTAKRVGSTLAESQKMTTQPIPKPIARRWMQPASQFQSEWPMAGTD